MPVMTLRRVGVLSWASTAAILYAFLGLIVGGIFALFALFGLTLGSAFHSGSDASPIFGLLFGLGAVIFAPIFYGILGFIIGLIGAALFNVAVRISGGVQLELT